MSSVSSDPLTLLSMTKLGKKEEHVRHIQGLKGGCYCSIYFY